MGKQKGPVRVKATVDHLQPGTHAYRKEGEVFEHAGDIYEHVKPVKGPVVELDSEDGGSETDLNELGE